MYKSDFPDLQHWSCIARSCQGVLHVAHFARQLHPGCHWRSLPVQPQGILFNPELSLTASQKDLFERFDLVNLLAVFAWLGATRNKRSHILHILCRCASQKSKAFISSSAPRFFMAFFVLGCYCCQCIPLLSCRYQLILLCDGKQSSMSSKHRQWLCCSAMGSAECGRPCILAPSWWRYVSWIV